MDLLNRIKLREPVYDENYYQFILDFTIEQGEKMGTASDKDRWEQGKYFSTRYEMYMYATLLGIKRDYKLPIEAGTKTRSFIKIGSWKPPKIADYIIMGILGKGDYDLFKLEKMESDEIENIITQIKKEIEGYANGGLDIIRSQAEENEIFFVENDNAFIDLLNE